MNFIKASCESKNGKSRITSTFFHTPLTVEAKGLDRKVTIGIRPEHLRLSPLPQKGSVEAKVRRKSITVGGQYLYSIERDGVEVKAKVSHPADELIRAETVWIELPVEHLVFFDGSQRRVHAPMAA